MKTVKCGEGGAVTCPVCGKKLVSDTSDFRPCRHVVAWYNTVNDDWSKASKAIVDGVGKLLSEDSGYKEAIPRFFRGRKDVVVVLFDGGYIGGCTNAEDIVVFKKAA